MSVCVFLYIYVCRPSPNVLNESFNWQKTHIDTHSDISTFFLFVYFRWRFRFRFWLTPQGSLPHFHSKWISRCREDFCCSAAICNGQVFHCATRMHFVLLKFHQGQVFSQVFWVYEEEQPDYLNPLCNKFLLLQTQGLKFEYRKYVSATMLKCIL